MWRSVLYVTEVVVVSVVGAVIFSNIAVVIAMAVGLAVKNYLGIHWP